MIIGPAPGGTSDGGGGGGDGGDGGGGTPSGGTSTVQKALPWALALFVAWRFLR
jgi:hypothetical protein